MQFRLLIPVWLLFIPFILPQQFNRTDEFHHKTINDGLADNTVYAIWQDELGFMWFGAEGGFNQYDGYSFRTFRANPDSKEGLQNHNISDIVCFNNQLWLATWGGGINIFDRKTETFTSFQHSATDKGSIGHNRVQVLFVDREGTLWAGTAGGGLNRLNKDKKTFQRYLHDPNNKYSISEDRVWGIAQDHQGYLWIATRTGINRFSIQQQKFTLYLPDPSDTRFSGANFVRTIFADHSGNVWAGTEKGLFLKRAYENHFERFSLVPEVHDLVVNSVFVSDNDVVLIGTGSDGLFYYDQRTGIQKHFISEPHSDSQLGSNDIRRIFKDSYGNFWIATREGGLSITRFTSPALKLFTRELYSKNALPDNHIRSLFADGATVYIGTGNNGFAQYLPETETINTIFERKSLDDPERRVLTITKAKDGHIYFATRAGIRKLSPITGLISKIPIKNITLALDPDNIQFLLPDLDGNLYVAARNTPLSVYHAATATWSEYPSDPDGRNGPIGEDIWHMTWGHDSLLWLATDNGVTSFDRKSLSFRTIGVHEKYQRVLKGISTLMLMNSLDGRIWMATERGLFYYQPSSDIIKRIEQKDGHSSSIINALIEDSDDRIWFSTNIGISVYDPSSDKIQNFQKADGFQVNDYISRSVTKTPNGDIYFGGLFGLLRITPSKLFEVKKPLSLHITAITSQTESGETLLYDLNCPNDKKITSVSVSPSQRDITISFVALNYFSISSARYYYQLEGFDEQWIDSKGRREIQYTNLSPGTYRFKVRAFESRHLRDSLYQSITITIETPYYATWWFRGIALIAIGLLITAFIRFRISSLERNKRKLEQLVLEKTKTLHLREEQLLRANTTKDKLFSIIGHDLRSPFTALMGYTEILGEEYHDLSDSDRKGFISRIHASLHGLLSLIDNLLTWSRLNQSRITPDLRVIQLHQLISSVIVSQSLAAERKNISMSLLCDEQIAAYADHNLTDAVIRNLLSNAIKFTPQGGRITITCLQESDQYVKIEVADTGLGLSSERVDEILQTESFVSTNGTEEEKGTGLGLNLCKQFVRIMHGKFLLSSEPGQGSVFTILLPSSESTPTES